MASVGVDHTNRRARLLDIVPGGSAEVFSDWIKCQPDEFRASIDHVALDAFAGYKKAATEVVAVSVTMLDLLRVVALVRTELDETRRRLHTKLHGRQGRSGDDLYRVRKTMIRTRVGLLSEKQKHHLNRVLGPMQGEVTV